MTKNMTLVLCASSFALVGLVSLQGCDVGETSSGPAAGAPAAGAPAAGAHSAGAPGAGAAGAHAGAGGATGGAGATAGAGGATAGAGGAAAGAGGSTAGAGGATAGAGGSTAGSGGASAGGGASGAAGSGGGATKDCTTFCADEMTTCTFGAAAPAAYTDLAACQTACGAYMTGDVGVYPAGPMSGNTYACRRWHLSKAATVSGTDKSDHCQHTKQTSTTCL